MRRCGARRGTCAPVSADRQRCLRQGARCRMGGRSVRSRSLRWLLGCLVIAACSVPGTDRATAALTADVLAPGDIVEVSVDFAASLSPAPHRLDYTLELGDGATAGSRLEVGLFAGSNALSTWANPESRLVSGFLAPVPDTFNWAEGDLRITNTGPVDVRLTGFTVEVVYGDGASLSHAYAPVASIAGPASAVGVVTGLALTAIACCGVRASAARTGRRAT
jgi:hypothetical protein